MKVVIDMTLCTGHGRCYALAPDVFDGDEEGHGTVIVDEVDGQLLSTAQEAVSNCPERAISIVDV